MKLSVLVAILLGTNRNLAAGLCPSSKQLRNSSGTFNYRGSHMKNKRCTWSFPVFAAQKNVIVIKITSLALYNSGCLAYLRFSDVAGFCEKPVGFCIVYSYYPTCEEEHAHEIIREANCTDLVWLNNKSTMRDIRYQVRSEGTATLSFSFDYKLFPCNSKAKAKSTGQMATSPTPQFKSVATGNETAQPEAIDDGISSGTLAGVIVFFILLLLACLGIIFWLYIRVRKLKAGSRLPRVQYELAKPRDITVLQISNPTPIGDTANGESHFPLHGEHRSNRLLQLTEDGASENQTEQSHNRSVDENYGDEIQQDYNSFTSDDSVAEDVPEDDPAYAYATVRKRAATNAT